MLGAFLSKGMQDPLGIIYSVFYEFFPGAESFRDPTKWYFLIAVSLSLLIPNAIATVAERINAWRRIHSHFILQYAFLICWTMLLIEAFTHNLLGLFAQREIPADYKVISTSIHDGDEIFRTLWHPTDGIFTYTTERNPSINSSTYKFFSEERLNDKNMWERLGNDNIRMLVVSRASIMSSADIGEKALGNDYLDLVKRLNETPYVNPIFIGKDASLYEIISFQPRIQFNSSSVTLISYSPIRSGYRANIQVFNEGEYDVLLSENYSPAWRLVTPNKTYYSVADASYRNVFSIRLDEGEYTIEFTVFDQKLLDNGFIFTLMVVSAITALFIYSLIQRRITHEAN
jgi:hypothetical protein